MRILLVTLFLFPYFMVEAQSFGNEWINYEQRYYKVKIWKDGIYRITREDLFNAIPDLQFTDPRNLQIFSRGNEQFIYIDGENDGQWDPGDFVEFYGQKNDGWLDEKLYPKPQDQTNPNFSLFTDTAIYFLTWNNNTQNRRIVPDENQNPAGISPAPYFLARIISQQNDRYYFGKTDNNNATDSEYTNGEGWSGIPYGAPKLNQITNLPSLNTFKSGPNARLDIFYKTISNAPTLFGDHRYQLHLNNILYLDTTMEGHGGRSFSLQIPASSLGATTTPYKYNYIKLTDNSGAGVTSNSAFSHYVWIYPHTFNLENKSSYQMFVPDNPVASKYTLNISSFAGGTGQVRLYDLTNNRRINVSRNGADYFAVLSNSLAGNNGVKECLIIAESQINQISAISPVNYVAGQPGRFNDFSKITGNEFVIISHRKLESAAIQYKNYRSGKYQTGLFFTDELYDQFSSGILQHPIALRRFCDFAISNWQNPPEYLLLLGKSVSAHNNRFNSSAWNENLVPTFGFPSSDNLFTAGLGSALKYEQALATGRVSARDNKDLNAYLNKLNEYENAEPAIWMKQILHFSGGSNTAEQQIFLNYLDTYKKIIEDTLFGGTVYTYQKKTSTPIEQTMSALIADYINNGVSLMTFFGHASGTGFDVSIDNPENYSNKGKYPFLIGNSCYAGDIHQPSGSGFSQSEEFTLIPDKGTIGFLSSVALSLPSLLNQYTDTLYRFMGQRHYGESMGKNMKYTARSIHSLDQSVKNLLLEMALSGDPSVSLNFHPLPDYMTSLPEVFFSPKEVTTALDSFELKIIVSNKGKAVSKPVHVEVTRYFPESGVDTTYNVMVSKLYFKDTVSIRMPVKDALNRGAGINNFSIRIDPLNQTEEKTKLNNDVNAELIIRSPEIFPVWPYEFSLVPDDSVTLIASTGDPFAKESEYLFQIDTTDVFANPLQNAKIRQAGGLVRWNPDFKLTDSTVYFWRVSPDTTSGTKAQWIESSFQFIKGKRGWSQDHYFQFKKNKFNLLSYNRDKRFTDFLLSAKELSVNVFGYPYLPEELWATSYKLDADLIAYAGCSREEAIYIAVIDSISLKPWYSPDNCITLGNQYGQFNNNCTCKNEPFAAFIFRVGKSAEMISMRNMLKSIPNGYYVLAYTWVRGMFQKWDSSVWSAFEELGAKSVRYLPDDYPWVFFTQKGRPSSATEIIADSANANLSPRFILKNSWISGDQTSVIIGPGTGWDTLSWRLRNFDNPKDSIRLQIIGIEPNGKEDVLTETLTSPSGNIELSQFSENLDKYLYLRLNAFIRDDSIRTPAQLDRWQVTFDEFPEAALDPLGGYFLHGDTLQQGDSLKFAISIKNISAIPMDSMLVAYWIQDPDRKISPIKYNRQKPLKPGETLLDTLSVSSTNLNGPLEIWVEANPDKDQPEKYHFNNIASRKFFVGSDKINPLLDVTFDGVHIMNGDIISSKPEIIIQLKDENKFLALDDTSSFLLFIRNPSQQISRPVFFRDHPELIFSPAFLPVNKARITWNPHFSEDGTYDLILKARDRSGNASGSIQYKISFEVVNRSAISNVYNYPNPFSTKTHFVFSLTGSKIPDYFNIQIYTITGKLIKEIGLEELGPIRIGRNMTEYFWDGKDEFGDQVANGIYLYKIISRIEGKDLDNFRTARDGYFTKGFGKMYLMR